MLFNQWDDTTARAQFGNVRSVKELASAANQTGRQRKLSETYGGAGWELTFTDMKRLGDWEYALGVNLMNQHLSHITLAGARKYDYPLTFTYHEPWWNDYKYLNNHYARLSVALSSGKQVNDILIIEPTTSAWLYDSYAARNPKYAVIGQTFQTFITKLEKNQVEYDLGSENIIKDLGTVKKGRFIVGQCSYPTVVLPPMIENLDLATFKLIKKFVSEDGTLVAFSVPSFVDGSESEELNEFFAKYKDKIIIEPEPDNSVTAKYFTSKSISFSEVTGGDLYHQRRVLSDGQIVFLVNSNLSETVKGSIKVKGQAAYEFNTLEGNIQGYPWTQDGEKVNLSFSLPPAGSLLLFIPEVYNERHITPAKPKNLAPVAANAQMKIVRDRDNVLTLEFCDLEIGGEITNDMHNFNAADKLYKYYGFKNGNPWNTSVQFKTRTVDSDTFGINTGFTATYHFNVKGDFDYSTFKAVVERPYLGTVSVNATELKAEEGKWWLDREFGVFSIGELVKKGDNTISFTVSPMKVHAEIEPVYILGDFSVVPAVKGWTLEAPVKELKTGSWKDQGMPFYSWGLTYSREYTIDKPEGRYLVELSNWKGIVAEVSVNGEPATIIAFPPYQSDITDLVKPGNNRIEVKVIGSLKNLLGPHFNNPAPGLVSPGHFRNVKSYPAGKDYQLLDYGLTDEFNLLQGK